MFIKMGIDFERETITQRLFKCLFKTNEKIDKGCVMFCLIIYFTGLHILVYRFARFYFCKTFEIQIALLILI